MCGFAGWLSQGRDLTCEHETIAAMTATMACRGPDESGVWTTPQIALGHRRLAVIDVPGGKQPMRVETPAGTVALVFAGEIYNFVELRRQLEQHGERFRTDSDTEVLLRGYLCWGDDVVTRMNGMFAAAIWDESRRRLVLVRDRLGVKPLYYFPMPDGVIFGSEPKAVLANPCVEPAVDADGLRELVELTQRPGWSLWKGMRSVAPGSLVTVDESGIRTAQYWRLRASPHTDGRQSTVNRVKELFSDSVRRQLVSDVPRCVLLSGGLDSSAITGVAAGRLRGFGEQLRTFSVDMVSGTHGFVADRLRTTPDTPYALEMASHVGSRHEIVQVNADELADPEVRRATVTARDGPAFGQLDASLYLLFKAVRSESTVALSGESADELFGGYEWFHSPGIATAGTFPWLAASHAGRTTRAPVFSPDLVRALDVPAYVADQYATAVAEVEHLDGESEDRRRMRVVCHLALRRFLPMWLERKDRMSMAVGLEVRVPFCDHRLVEYVYNVPWALKTFDHREKSLLRHAVADVLPRSVATRVKSAYPWTHDPAYESMIRAQAQELAHDRSAEVFSVVSRDWLRSATSRSNSTASIEWLLDLHHWFDLYRPSIVI
ncbi:asparagine synthase (glutamine-hydrolyzing) [Kribbella sp.]|uniref:asparagine synthase (glutamine-hydrolyzing) n=1 Tax=Kribbella sp. TaxID=1871183 RepID=UPI002D230BC3|nr:asparagine synthase (glutamine-hydrolyzing) [Kribbella sp.]HZX08261.1 asparagine synthase (glutamine-hydrolyzing) [Kribbella sp.]